MMKLGLFLAGSGHHIAAWRHPDVFAEANQSIAHYANLARTAERGRFDLVFNADTAAIFGPDDVNVWSRTVGALRLEPLTMLAALAMVTERIGLVSTATTTYNEPYHVARFFASLDQLSGGRVGWNLVTSQAAAEAFNFSRTAHIAHEDRYERAAEFAQVVLGLWDTWEDDAIIADKESGLYFDPAKLHLLNHTGKHFAVRGPLTVRRSPQGRPVIVQAGQSDTGRELAAEIAEVIFTVQQDLEAARDFHADIKARAARHGRGPDAIKIMPGVMPVIGRTRAEAEAKYERLQALIHPSLGVAVLSEMYGMDLAPYPLDGPLPAPPEGGAHQQGRRQLILDIVRRDNPTIRQLYQRVAGARAHRAICGTAAEVADLLDSLVPPGRGGRVQHHALHVPRRARRLRRWRHPGVAAPRALPHRV